MIGGVVWRKSVQNSVTVHHGVLETSVSIVLFPFQKTIGNRMGLSSVVLFQCAPIGVLIYGLCDSINAL